MRIVVLVNSMMAPYAYIVSVDFKLAVMPPLCWYQRRRRLGRRFVISFIDIDTGESAVAPGTHSHWSRQGARAELLTQPAVPQGLGLPSSSTVGSLPFVFLGCVLGLGMVESKYLGAPERFG